MGSYKLKGEKMLRNQKRRAKQARAALRELVGWWEERARASGDEMTRRHQSWVDAEDEVFVDVARRRAEHLRMSIDPRVPSW